MLQMDFGCARRQGKLSNSHQASGGVLDSPAPRKESRAMTPVPPSLRSIPVATLALLFLSAAWAGAAATGWTVVSDIDDTIRQTGVVKILSPACPQGAHPRDYAHLIGDPFRRFEAVPGMAARFQQWHAHHRTEFLYLSQGPWFYRGRLERFLRAGGFPPGRIRLNPFFPFTSPRFKDAAIRELLRAQPDRAFVFIGDSGERDPEIYAHLAAGSPRAVRRIFIRDVTPHDPSLRQRLAAARVPASIFTRAAQLPAALDRPAKLPPRHDQTSPAHRR